MSAVLWAGGGLVVLGSLPLLPAPSSSANEQLMLVIGLVAISTAAAMLLFSARIPASTYPPQSALGSVVIAAIVTLSEQPFLFALLYMWIALFAGLFYSRTLAAFLSVWSVATYAVALVLLEAPVVLPVGLLAATLAVITLVMGWLSSASAHARVDALTGVANRRELEERLARELAHARETGEPLSVAMLDVDHFKGINDRLGHAVGDELLRRVAATWRRHLREHDVVGRFGGDEFTMLLPGVPAHRAVKVVDRLRELPLPDEASCSAGVAPAYPDDTVSLVLQRADAALYRAKQAGRDQTALSPEAVVETGDEPAATAGPQSADG